MYINPFLAGMLVSVFAASTIFSLFVIISAIKARRNK